MSRSVFFPWQRCLQEDLEVVFSVCVEEAGWLCDSARGRWDGGALAELVPARDVLEFCAGAQTENGNSWRDRIWELISTSILFITQKERAELLGVGQDGSVRREGQQLQLPRQAGTTCKTSLSPSVLLGDLEHLLCCCKDVPAFALLSGEWAASLAVQEDLHFWNKAFPPGMKLCSPWFSCSELLEFQSWVQGLKSEETFLCLLWAGHDLP